MLNGMSFTYQTLAHVKDTGDNFWLSNVMLILVPDKALITAFH
jgi:hypothetical protein